MFISSETLKLWTFKFQITTDYRVKMAEVLSFLILFVHIINWCVWLINVSKWSHTNRCYNARPLTVTITSYNVSYSIVCDISHFNTVSTLKRVREKNYWCSSSRLNLYNLMLHRLPNLYAVFRFGLSFSLSLYHKIPIISA